MQAAGYAGAHVLQNEEVEKRDYRAGRHAVPGSKGGDGGRGYEDDGDDGGDGGDGGECRESRPEADQSMRPPSQ